MSRRRGRHRSPGRRPTGGRTVLPWAVMIAVGALVVGISLTSKLGPAGAGDQTAGQPIQISATAPARSVDPATATATTTSPSVRTADPQSPAKSSEPADVEPADVEPADVEPAGSEGPGATVVESADPATVGVPTPGFPVSIVLTPDGGAVPILPIGVAADGVLTPPDDSAQAGWWVAGPRPGEVGRAIVAGHIDSPAGLGAFAALDRVDVGDPVVLTTSDGVELRYRVVGRQLIDKAALDPSSLVRDDGGSDLLLVTCIGEFDRQTLSYESNLLILAEPV